MGAWLSQFLVKKREYDTTNPSSRMIIDLEYEVHWFLNFLQLCFCRLLMNGPTGGRLLSQLLCLANQILHDGIIWSNIRSLVDDICSPLKADMDSNVSVLFRHDWRHLSRYGESQKTMQGMSVAACFIEISRNLFH